MIISSRQTTRVRTHREYCEHEHNCERKHYREHEHNREPNDE
jgi:hypothetical protein